MGQLASKYVLHQVSPGVLACLPPNWMVLNPGIEEEAPRTVFEKQLDKLLCPGSNMHVSTSTVEIGGLETNRLCRNSTLKKVIPFQSISIMILAKSERGHRCEK